MIILKTTNIAFLNARSHWIENRQDRWGFTPESFAEWLRAQGAKIDQSARSGIATSCDNLGVCIAIDTVLFDSEQQATLFLLRWS